MSKGRRVVKNSDDQLLVYEGAEDRYSRLRSETNSYLPDEIHFKTQAFQSEISTPAVLG